MHVPPLRVPQEPQILESHALQEGLLGEEQCRYRDKEWNTACCIFAPNTNSPAAQKRPSPADFKLDSLMYTLCFEQRD